MKLNKQGQTDMENSLSPEDIALTRSAVDKFGPEFYASMLRAVRPHAQVYDLPQVAMHI
jgi:hypothetical protein